MARIPAATGHPAMGSTPMKNRRIIGRIPTQRIIATSPAPGVEFASGSRVQGGPVSANVAAAFPR